jgi:hypothetical protein
MAGRNRLTAMHSTADYKDVKALKSCFTEFVHIHSAAFLIYKEDAFRKGVSSLLLGEGAMPCRREAMFFEAKLRPGFLFSLQTLTFAPDLI